jgi:lipopolysaccharide transport system ATP-binding protein
MSAVVIQVENLSKFYRLGVVGTGTVSHDLNRWWARLRGKPDPALRVDQVRKSVHGTPEHNGDDDYIWALRDINFEVKQGEVLGIIGRNGAGKSTLLKILSRVTAPTTGECRVKGRIASLLEVGTGFHPELTGRENIYLNGAILGMTKGEIGRKFDEIVNFSEVEKYIDTPVKRYSSGMYVRLAFAVAAHLDPEILIVDEVLAVGDAAFQKKCLGKMQDVSKGGRTVLFVSHNMGAVSSLCEQAFLLKDGELIYKGPTEQTISLYLSNMVEQSAIAVKNRTDRRGDGKGRYIGIRFVNSNGRQVTQISSGDDLAIRLDIEAAEPISSANFAIGFYNQMGFPLAHCNWRVSGQPLARLPSCASVVCHIPKVPLPPGTYRLNLLLEVAGNIADHVEGAALIEVVGGAFFPSGIIPPASVGATLFEHFWKLEIPS